MKTQAGSGSRGGSSALRWRSAPGPSAVVVFALVAFAAFAPGEGVARAQLVETAAPVVPDVPAGLVAVSAGLRSSRVASEGYAPFSQNKAFTESDLSGFLRVKADERRALYLGASVGWGLAEAAARDATAHLDVFRAELSAQGLYALRPFLFAVGRAGLGASSREASLTGEAGGTFRQKLWQPTASASAGLAVRVAARSVDLWLAVEGGYRYAPSRRVSLTRGEEDPAVNRESIDFGALALGGPTLGVRVGLFF